VLVQLHMLLLEVASDCIRVAFCRTVTAMQLPEKCAWLHVLCVVCVQSVLGPRVTSGGGSQVRVSCWSVVLVVLSARLAVSNT
jgi:hypothetical protein